MNGIFILQRCLSDRKVFLYRSSELNFLDEKNHIEPLAVDDYASKWRAIYAQLKNVPLNVVGR